MAATVLATALTMVTAMATVLETVLVTAPMAMGLHQLPALQQKIPCRQMLLEKEMATVAQQATPMMALPTAMEVPTMANQATGSLPATVPVLAMVLHQHLALRQTEVSQRAVDLPMAQVRATHQPATLTMALAMARVATMEALATEIPLLRPRMPVLPTPQRRRA